MQVLVTGYESGKVDTVARYLRDKGYIAKTSYKPNLNKFSKASNSSRYKIIILMMNGQPVSFDKLKRDIKLIVVADNSSEEINMSIMGELEKRCGWGFTLDPSEKNILGLMIHLIDPNYFMNIRQKSLIRKRPRHTKSTVFS